MSASRLLQLAIPLVKTHGFTREALSLSVLSLPKPHSGPLSETAVNALFGQGDDARRTLIQAWLDEGRKEMGKSSLSLTNSTSPLSSGLKPATPSIGDVLKARLKWNEPVLPYLPEAFALIASPTNALPPLDPTPLLKHAASVADEACHITGDSSQGTSWYIRRTSLGAIYSAAELHQMTSPQTAYEFLDSLLNSSQSAESMLGEAGLFAHYIGRSWAGIAKSSGIF